MKFVSELYSIIWAPKKKFIKWKSEILLVTPELRVYYVIFPEHLQRMFISVLQQNYCSISVCLFVCLLSFRKAGCLLPAAHACFTNTLIRVFSIPGLNPCTMLS